jgi:zinc transport system substrate-binding protein
MNRWATIVISSFAFLVAPLGNGFAADKLSVFVSIVPQKYFVQQIGKDLVDVQVMVLPGASPATYEPKPKQMADLSKTKVYFAIGVPFENAWLEKIANANPNMQVIHTDQGIEKLAMKAHHHQDDHDEGEHHAEADQGHEKGRAPWRREA